jgi:hypothetical protein
VNPRVSALLSTAPAISHVRNLLALPGSGSSSSM